jgi:hypothetical protein
LSIVHFARIIRITTALALIGGSSLLLSPAVHAQSAVGSHPAAGTMPSDAPHGMSMDMEHDHGAAAEAGVVPTSPGQDAFGAIQEIVHILEADPKTDWSKVNLEALRQHLIDMNEVTLKTNVVTKPIKDGIQSEVTGTGRTLAAILRMVPAHAHEIEETHLNGWSAKAQPVSNGVLLTVTSADPTQVEHLRGLGFIGVMVSGHHHQPHHLAMARGETVH